MKRDFAFIVSQMDGLLIKRVTTVNAPIGTYNGTIVPTGAAQTEFQYIDRVLTSNPLWVNDEWPNEARIRADLTGPDQKRTTNPANVGWQSNSDLGYAGWNDSILSLKDYIGI